MNKRHFPSFSAVILFALLITHPSTAQKRTQVHLGLNRTTFSGESNSDFSAATRFSAGIGLGFAISGGFFVQPEVVYAVKGASAINEDISVQARFTITYFEFPLLLGYQFAGESIRPRLYAGPYLGRKLKAELTFQSLEGGPTFSETDESVVEWDYGIVLGGAIHFSLIDEELAIGARASLGLAEVTQATEGVVLDQSLSNQSVGIYAAILF